MIHKNCLMGWLDNQIDKSEKENNTEMVKAYTNVLNLIQDSDALGKVEYCELVDVDGSVEVFNPVSLIVLNQYKIRVRCLNGD